MPGRILGKMFPKSRCFYLLLSLVILIYVYPAMSDYPFAFPVLGILFAITPLTGIYAVSDDRRTLIIAAILGAPALLSMIWHF